MNISSHFSNIRNVIINDIKSATKSISIAVAWFTNHEIFDELVEKLNQGVKVNLIILNDDINLREFSLDFQKIIDAGGNFWLASAEHPMHHKFCIIDESILITGSYNYTYLADCINHENIVRFQGVSDIINSYQEEFCTLTNEQPIKVISEYIKNNPPKINYYSFNNFRITDIYQYACELKEMGSIEKGKNVISQLENDTNVDNSNLSEFQISNVIYQHWQKEYYVDKITVTHTEIIVSFRTEKNSETWWIQGIGVPCSWIIEDINSKEIIHASKIQNITVNGNILLKETQYNTIYHFGSSSDDVPEEIQLKRIEDSLYMDTQGKHIKLINIDGCTSGTMTVDVTFPHKKHWENKTINFLEGQTTREKTNYWHCLCINLKLNRETYQ